MQRYHDVISSFGGKTSYDADNRPLLVMRSNLWASGYDVDGTDQTSLGQLSGRVQQTYKHSVPRFFVFFFQAEDGIRDVAVTGVQTCALPILNGHTDNMGTHDGNMDLAMRRAQAVRDWLQRKAPANFPDNRFRIQAYGDSKPVEIGRASCRERV